MRRNRDELRRRFEAGVVVDGGLATELEKRGFSVDSYLWSAAILLEQPQAIEELHYDYLKAGAEVLITASYQATFEGLAQKGLSHDQAAALILKSVEIAKQARERFVKEGPAPNEAQPLIAASVGPYGAYLHDGSEYRGDYALSVDELIDFHRSRFELLVSSDADFLACETIPSLDEAKAYVELINANDNACAWLSFSCRDDAHTCKGETIEEAAALADACDGVLAIGVNCTAPHHVEGLVQRIRATTDKPIVVYPNSGEEWDGTSHCWTGSAEKFLDFAKAWHESGASVIGGCCRTGPEQVQGVHALLHSSP